MQGSKEIADRLAKLEALFARGATEGERAASGLKAWSAEIHSLNGCGMRNPHACVAPMITEIARRFVFPFQQLSDIAIFRTMTRQI